MPMTTTGLDSGALVVGAYGSIHGTWYTLNSDARNANSAAERLCPTSIASSGTANWVMVPAGVTRVIVRALAPIAVTAVGTNPVVQLHGLYDPTASPLLGVGGGVSATGAVSASAVIPYRLDSTDPTNAGTAIAFQASPSVTNTYNNGTYWYSPEWSLGNIDTKGVHWITALISTASSTTASAAVIIQGMFLN